jgi:hypothetical protein
MLGPVHAAEKLEDKGNEMFRIFKDMDFSGKRIVVHIGTPKTGTTALQSCLASNASVLEEAGWRYPPIYASRGVDIRHQGLVTALIRGNLEETRPLFQDIQGCTAKNIFISSEGFYNNLPRIEERFIDLLSHMSELMEVEVTCVFRDREAFIFSLYKQLVFGGPWRVLPLSGYRGTLEDFANEQEVRYLLDCDGVVERFRAAGLKFVPVHYSQDVISEYEKLYFGVNLDRSGVRPNHGHTSKIYDLMRWCNIAGATVQEKRNLLGLLAGRALSSTDVAALGVLLERIAGSDRNVVFASRPEDAEALFQKARRLYAVIRANPPSASRA